MHPFIPLFQFFFSFFISIFVLLSLTTLLYKHKKSQEKIITPPVIINITAWSMAALFDLGYTTTSITAWFTSGGFKSGEIQSTILYWNGALYFAATTAVSMSVFFITLDRCLIFTPSLFMDERLKSRLYFVNLLMVVGDFILMMVIFIIFEKPKQEFTKCQTFSCVTEQNALTLNVARMFFGCVNTIIATTFAVLFYRYNKQREARMLKHPANVQVFNGQQQNQQQQINAASRGNKVAWVAVFSEIFFNFLPNLLSMVAQVVFDFVLSTYAGPLVSTFTNLEALITTIVYFKLIWRRIVQPKVSDTNKTNTYV